jgi:hypothetical protein
MGKKIKNRKKIKNSIPATFDLEEVLQARTLKLEYQLREIEVQKEAEIAATLEMGKKEGYILGCRERLETARQVADVSGGASRQPSTTFTSNANTNTESATIPPIASAICTPREVTALQSSSPNPWGSLSRRHRHSHPCKPSVHARHLPFHYTTDNHKHIPLISSSSTETIETIRHPYGIRSVKPVIRAPIANSFVASPIHHTPLTSESITQSPLCKIGLIRNVSISRAASQK